MGGGAQFKPTALSYLTWPGPVSSLLETSSIPGLPWTSLKSVSHIPSWSSLPLSTLLTLVSLRTFHRPLPFLTYLENPNQSRGSNDHLQTDPHVQNLTKPKHVQLKVPHQKSIIFIQPAPPCTQSPEWASIPDHWAFPLYHSPLPSRPVESISQIPLPTRQRFYKRFLIVCLSSALINTFTLNTLIVLITVRINSKLFNLPYKALHDPALPTPRLISPYSTLICVYSGWYKCHRLNVCVPPNTKVICLYLIPSVMVFGYEVFRRWLGHEAGALMNGIGDLIKGTPESSLPCCHVRTPKEDSQPWTRKLYSPFTKSASTLTLDFQPPEPWKINVCFLRATQPVIFYHGNLSE